MCSSWLFSHSSCVCMCIEFISHKSAYASTWKFIDKILLFLFIQYKDCFLSVRCISTYEHVSLFDALFTVHTIDWVDFSLSLLWLCWLNKLQWCGSPQYCPVFSSTLSTAHFFLHKTWIFHIFLSKLYYKWHWNPYTYSNNSKMLATHLSTEWWRW